MSTVRSGTSTLKQYGVDEQHYVVIITRHPIQKEGRSLTKF